MVSTRRHARPAERPGRGLDDLLHDARGDGVEFPPALANHAPMALTVLHLLGASDDRLHAFQAGYRRANGLVPPPPPVAPMRRDTLARFYGDRASETDFRDFYGAEVARLGIRDAVALHLPPLLPGIAASAFHALMRLAYGVVRNDPAEVGTALGYWAATSLPLPAPTGAPPDTDDPATVLARVAAIPGLRSIPPYDHLWYAMRAVGADPGFAPAVDWLRIGEGTLARMAATALALFAGTMDFAALHALTGAHWVRMVASVHPGPDLPRRFWQAVASLVSSMGFPVLPDGDTLARWRVLPCPDWPAIVAAALMSDDEHDFSLVYSAREEEKAYGDRLYRVVAARRMGLIPLTPTAATTLLLADARLPDGRAVDVAVAGERISAVTPAGTAARPLGATVIECAAALVAPSFVEGHIHLDKTLLGLPLVPHVPGGAVAERIAAEKALRRTLPSSVEERGGRLIEQVAAFGTGALRTHVDIDTDVTLSGLDAVLRLKDRHRDLVDVQVVAFPQSGILRDPGTADLLAAAVAAGADLVGGLDPAGIDGDVSGHLDAVFAIAERHGVGIDLHLHDPGPLGAFELRAVAERTRALGLGGRVAVSHAYALGAIEDGEFGRTAQALAGAGVAVMTNAPGVGPMPPVLRLRAAGVTVFAGSDNIRDAWWPYGDGDMLDRAHMIGYRQGFFTDGDLAHAFAMAGDLPASVLGLGERGVAPGRPADLVLIPAASVPEAVLDRPRDRIVVKRGRVVARNGRLVRDAD